MDSLPRVEMDTYRVARSFWCSCSILDYHSMHCTLSENQHGMSSEEESSVTSLLTESSSEVCSWPILCKWARIAPSTQAINEQLNYLVGSTSLTRTDEFSFFEILLLPRVERPFKACTTTKKINLNSIFVHWEIVSEYKCIVELCHVCVSTDACSHNSR